jgi:hypothetical protein
MTILVVFGIPSAFGIDHGASVQSDCGEDRVYFVEDRQYADGDALLNLPKEQGRRILSVLQHKGSSGADRATQLTWLGKNTTYEPRKVGLFSHYGRKFEELKALFHEDKSAVATVVKRYGDSVVFELLDEVAAYHALVEASNEIKSEEHRQYLESRRAGMVKLAQLLGNEHKLFGTSDPQELKRLMKEELAKIC